MMMCSIFTLQSEGMGEYSIHLRLSCLPLYIQGRETRDLWRHICYSKGAAIVEMLPMCGKFFCLFLYMLSCKSKQRFRELAHSSCYFENNWPFGTTRYSWTFIYLDMSFF